MREAINEKDLDSVVGGTVHLSEQQNAIGFDTTGECFLLNCPFEDARTLVATLFATDGYLGNREFDELVKNSFASRGWLISL